MSNRVVSRSITAANQWTDWIDSSDGSAMVDVQGSFTADVTWQVRPQKDVGDVDWPDADAGAKTLKVFTAATDPAADDVCTKLIGGPLSHRIGVATGDFTSGPVKVWLGVRNAFSPN